MSTTPKSTGTGQRGRKRATPPNKEEVVQSTFDDACQTPKKRGRRTAPLADKGLQDLLRVLATPKTCVEGEPSSNRQMEKFTRLTDLPVPSVLEVHAVETTTIHGSEVGRVECVTVGNDGRRYSTVVLIPKRHAAAVTSLPGIIVYLGKKSQTKGNPYNWIAVVTEQNRRQAGIPSPCSTRDAADFFRRMEKEALETLFVLYKPKDFPVGSVLAYDTLRRFPIRDSAPKDVGTDVLLASFRTYIDDKSLNGEMMVPTRCEKEAIDNLPGIIQIGEEATGKTTGYSYVPLSFYHVSKVRELQERLEGTARPVVDQVERIVLRTNKSGVKDTIKEEQEVVELSDDDGFGECETSEAPPIFSDDDDDDDDDTRGAMEGDAVIHDSPESPVPVADGADDGDANGKGDDDADDVDANGKGDDGAADDDDDIVVAVSTGETRVIDCAQSQDC